MDNLTLDQELCWAKLNQRNPEKSLFDQVLSFKQRLDRNNRPDDEYVLYLYNAEHYMEELLQLVHVRAIHQQEDMVTLFGVKVIWITSEPDHINDALRYAIGNK